MAAGNPVFGPDGKGEPAMINDAQIVICGTS
jgi:hypothetical protein